MGIAPTWARRSNVLRVEGSGTPRPHRTALAAFSLSVLLGVLVPACTSAPPEQTSADTLRVTELFEHPTESALRQLVGDYTATDHDVRLLLVYWGGLAIFYETTQFPDALASQHIQEEVLKLAGKFPSFFAAGADDDPGLGATLTLRPLSHTGTDFEGCHKQCARPSDDLALTAISCLAGVSALSKAILTAANGSQELAQLKSIFRVFEGIADSKTLTLADKLATAASGDFLGLALGLVGAATTAIAAGAAVGLASPAIAANALIVGGIAAAIQCAKGIDENLTEYLRCEALRKEHACDVCGDVAGVVCGATCCPAPSVCLTDAVGEKLCSPLCARSSQCPSDKGCCELQSDGFGVCKPETSPAQQCLCNTVAECSTGACGFIPGPTPGYPLAFVCKPNDGEPNNGCNAGISCTVDHCCVDILVNGTAAGGLCSKGCYSDADCGEGLKCNEADRGTCYGKPGTCG